MEEVHKSDTERGFEEIWGPTVECEYNTDSRSYAAFNIRLSFLPPPLASSESAAGHLSLNSPCFKCEPSSRTVFATCYSMRYLGLLVHVMDEVCADPVAVNSSTVHVTGSRLCIVFSFEQLFLLGKQRQYAIHRYHFTPVSNYAYSFTRITGQHLQRFSSLSLQVVTKSVRTDGASRVNTLRAASGDFIWY